jgi:hypothetical protein
MPGVHVEIMTLPEGRQFCATARGGIAFRLASACTLIPAQALKARAKSLLLLTLDRLIIQFVSPIRRLSTPRVSKAPLMESRASITSVPEPA